jgi:acyl-CoA thioesterase
MNVVRLDGGEDGFHTAMIAGRPHSALSRRHPYHARMTNDDAIFIPQGDAFMPTAHAGSPWGPGLLHGGPPAGLLARAIELAKGDPDLHVSRLTIDLFRPVPSEPLRTTVRTLRAGRRIAVLEASLMAGDVEVSHATALLLRQSEVDLPAEALPAERWVPAHEGVPTTSMSATFRTDDDGRRRGPSGGAMLPGFHTVVEVRRVGGEPGTGRATAWIRIPVPFVAGEETSPLVRVAALSDFGNALGHVRPNEDVGFINADISLYLHRLPEGEWVCLEAHGVAQEHGLGMVETVVLDMHGPIGRVCQALIVNRRHQA